METRPSSNEVFVRAVMKHPDGRHYILAVRKEDLRVVVFHSSKGHEIEARSASDLIDNLPYWFFFNGNLKNPAYIQQDLIWGKEVEGFKHQVSLLLPRASKKIKERKPNRDFVWF